jgi:DNA-binding NtrC family response regulator
MSVSSAIRILIVEGDSNVRGALRGVLELGYQVEEASDGLEGLDKLHAFLPEVVLVSVRLAKVDGPTLIRRAREGGSPASFLVMTEDIHGTVDALQKGAETFLLKPLDFGVVLVTLERVLEKRRLEREAQALRARVAELEAMVNRRVAAPRPPPLRPSPNSGRPQTLYEIERDAILRTLETVNGSTTRAAQVLGISIRKIQSRLKLYSSDPAPSRGPAGEAPDQGGSTPR